MKSIAACINFQSFSFSAPSVVGQIQVTQREPTGFTLTWTPPKTPNGIITEYEIRAIPDHPKVRNAAPLVHTVSNIEMIFINDIHLIECVGRTKSRVN